MASSKKFSPVMLCVGRSSGTNLKSSTSSQASSLGLTASFPPLAADACLGSRSGLVGSVQSGTPTVCLNSATKISSAIPPICVGECSEQVVVLPMSPDAHVSTTNANSRPCTPTVRQNVAVDVHQSSFPAQVSEPGDCDLQPIPGSILQPTKSFAAVVRGTGFVRKHASAIVDFGKVPDLHIDVGYSSKDGCPAITFEEDVEARTEALFNQAIVIKFLNGRPPLEICHSVISSSWGLQGQFAMGLLDSRTLLIRLELLSDVVVALSIEESKINNFSFKVYRWNASFNGRLDESTAPVWLSLPKLPINCFVPSILKAIGNGIGKFLRVDLPTSSLTRPSAARLCVEVNLKEELPKKIWIGMYGGFWQSIDYGRIPSFCSSCLRQGHSSVACRSQSSLGKQQQASASLPPVSGVQKDCLVPVPLVRDPSVGLQQSACSQSQQNRFSVLVVQQENCPAVSPFARPDVDLDSGPSPAVRSVVDQDDLLLQSVTNDAVPSFAMAPDSAAATVPAVSDVRSVLNASAAPFLAPTGGGTDRLSAGQCRNAGKRPAVPDNRKSYAQCAADGSAVDSAARPMAGRVAAGLDHAGEVSGNAAIRRSARIRGTSSLTSDSDADDRAMNRGPLRGYPTVEDIVGLGAHASDEFILEDYMTDEDEIFVKPKTNKRHPNGPFRINLRNRRH